MEPVIWKLADKYAQSFNSTLMYFRNIFSKINDLNVMVRENNETKGTTFAKLNSVDFRIIVNNLLENIYLYFNGRKDLWADVVDGLYEFRHNFRSAYEFRDSFKLEKQAKYYIEQYNNVFRLLDEIENDVKIEKNFWQFAPQPEYEPSLHDGHRKLHKQHNVNEMGTHNYANVLDSNMHNSSGYNYNNNYDDDNGSF